MKRSIDDYIIIETVVILTDKEREQVRRNKLNALLDMVRKYHEKEGDATTD